MSKQWVILTPSSEEALEGKVLVDLSSACKISRDNSVTYIYAQPMIIMAMVLETPEEIFQILLEGEL